MCDVGEGGCVVTSRNVHSGNCCIMCYAGITLHYVYLRGE